MPINAFPHHHIRFPDLMLIIIRKVGVDVPVSATDIVSLITETMGRGDRSFNDTAWKGVSDVRKEVGIDRDRYHHFALISPGVTKNLDSRFSPKGVLK